MRGRGRNHIFDDPRVLNEMLALRRQGVGPTQLSQRYQGVHHSTIIYHCKRNGVVVRGGKSLIIISSGILAVAAQAEVVQPKPKIVIQFGAPKVVLDFDGEPINQGHNYADYIRIKRQREEDRLFNKPRSKA